MMIVENKYELGQEVMLKNSNTKYIVIGLLITPHEVKYQLACGVQYSFHLDIEIETVSEGELKHLIRGDND